MKGPAGLAGWIVEEFRGCDEDSIFFDSLMSDASCMSAPILIKPEIVSVWITDGQHRAG